MLKIMWVIVAIHSSNGFEFEQRLPEHQFETVGQCATEALGLPTDTSIVAYECAKLYDGKKYSTQPSWMSDEQADKILEQRLLHETAQLHARVN